MRQTNTKVCTLKFFGLGKTESILFIECKENKPYKRKQNYQLTKIKNYG